MHSVPSLTMPVLQRGVASHGFPPLQFIALAGLRQQRIRIACPQIRRARLLKTLAPVSPTSRATSPSAQRRRRRYTAAPGVSECDPDTKGNSLASEQQPLTTRPFVSPPPSKVPGASVVPEDATHLLPDPSNRLFRSTTLPDAEYYNNILIPGTRRINPPASSPPLPGRVGQIFQSELTKIYAQLLAFHKGQPSLDLAAHSARADLDFLWKLYCQIHRCEQPSVTALWGEPGRMFLELIWLYGHDPIWSHRADNVFDNWIRVFHPAGSAMTSGNVRLSYYNILRIHARHACMWRIRRRVRELVRRVGARRVFCDKYVALSQAIALARSGMPDKAEMVLKRRVKNLLKSGWYTEVSRDSYIYSELRWAVLEIYYAYGRLGRCDDVQRIFGTMQRAGIPVSTRIANTLLKSVASLKSNDMSVIVGAYNDMRTLGVEPDAATFNILIGAALEREEVGQARRWLDVMTDAKLRPDAYTFGTIIAQHIAKGQWREGESLLGEMGHRSVLPDDVARTSVMYGYYVQNRIERVMREYESRFVPPELRPKLEGNAVAENTNNSHTSSTRNNPSTRSSSDGCAASSRPFTTGMPKMSPHLASVLIKAALTDPKQWGRHLALVIRSIDKQLGGPKAILSRMLCKLPHIEELVSPEGDFEFLQKLANSQWLELLSDGGVLDIPSCRNLVLSLSRNTNTSYDVALVLLIQHALSLKRFDLALPLSRVGNIKHSNPYYTMALIQVALASRNESRAIELALAAIRSPEASNRSSLIHLTQILSHLVNARYFAAAKPIVKRVTSLVCKSPSLPAFDALINYYSELHDTENVEVVWQKLIGSGIRPDVKVHCSRITAHSLSQSNNHANLLKAFDEFLATQMAPNTKIITMVVRSYCKNGQPTHAIALIERAVHQWGLQPTTTAMNNLILVLSTRKRSYKSAFQIFNTMCLSWLRGDQGLGPAAEGSNDWNHVYSVCKESRTSPSDDVREPEQLADTGSGQQRRGFMSWLTSQVHWTPHTSTGTHQLGLPSQVLGLNHNSAATIGGGGRDGGDDNNDRGVSSMKDWNHRTSSLPGVIIPPPSFHTFKIIIPASCRFGELSHVSYIWWMFLLWSKSPNFNSSGISVLKPVVSDPPSPASGPDRFAKLSAQLRALCSAEAAHNTKATLGPMFRHMAGLVDDANFQQQRMLRKQKLVMLSMGILKRLDHEGKLVKRLGDAILKPLLQPSNIDSNAAPGP